MPPAGAPAGAVLLYQGTWESIHVPSGMLPIIPSIPTLPKSATEIISQVSSNMPGLQLMTQQNDAGVKQTLGLNPQFHVQLQVQVIGNGFASPQDAKSIIDHAYYMVMNTMPITSSINVVSGGSGPGLPPGTNLPSSTGCPQGYTMGPTGCTATSMSSWFQQNAGTLALFAVALVAVPAFIKKL
jgi:hypothetical protein